MWIVTQAEFDRRLALGEARLVSESEATREEWVARFVALQAKYRAQLRDTAQKGATVHVFIPRGLLVSERLAA